MIRYRPFELHTHTVHSDGDFTPAALVQAAHDFGCAGIALTDHNTDAGMQEIYEAARDSLLPVAAIRICVSISIAMARRQVLMTGL